MVEFHEYHRPQGAVEAQLQCYTMRNIGVLDP